MAAVTNYHGLGSLKATHLFSYSSSGQKFGMGLTGLKSRKDGLLFFLEALGDNPFSWLCQLLGDAPILYLPPSSSLARAS